LESRRFVLWDFSPQTYIMSISTKQGDRGQTRLIFGGTVSKADLQVEAYGTIDELNSFLGLARSFCDDERTKTILESFQRETFIVGAELATPKERVEKLSARVSPEMTARLDEIGVEIEAMEGLLGDWSVPGATQFSAALDCARTVARRAERHVVRLYDAEVFENAEILRYLNRLSDVLWLLGRRLELERGIDSALR
jgi:cob(I)alamin adenosyltransferase